MHMMAAVAAAELLFCCPLPLPLPLAAPSPPPPLPGGPHCAAVNAGQHMHHRPLVTSSAHPPIRPVTHPSYTNHVLPPLAGQSKLANILFTYELSRRIASGALSGGSGNVTANCLHPGVVRTELPRYLMEDPDAPMSRLITALATPFTLSPEQVPVPIHCAPPHLYDSPCRPCVPQAIRAHPSCTRISLFNCATGHCCCCCCLRAQGARTSIYLASSPDVEGVSGKYFDSCRPVSSNPASYDTTTAARLWDVSEELTAAARPPARMAAAAATAL